MNINKLRDKVEKELSHNQTWTEGLFQHQQLKVLDAVKLSILNATNKEDK